MPTVKTHIIREGYDGKTCLVHARMCPVGNGEHIVASVQPLNVAGCDSFSEVMFAESLDGGKTFSGFRLPEDSKGSITDGNVTRVACDMTPFYHEKTGKVLLIGSSAGYQTDDILPVSGYSSLTYRVFDPVTHKPSPMRIADMKNSSFVLPHCGSGQCVILENGNVIIPVTGMLPDGKRCLSAAAEFSFDGETLSFLREGNRLLPPDGEPRGIYEPSICRLGDGFYMTLRSDLRGYVCRSEDGLSYSEPKPWAFSDGEPLPTYNTQSHFFTLGGELYLVYTRKAGFNDHVFRHRAPLFCAKVNRETLTLDRESEFIAVPERGARLGNFCAGNFSADRAFVMAAEWMQPVGCEKYGSDNAVFLSVIE